MSRALSPFLPEIMTEFVLVVATVTADVLWAQILL